LDQKPFNQKGAVVMSNIKDIGAVRDKDGAEVRLGWSAKDNNIIGSSWNVYLRFSNTWWKKQESVLVRISEEAQNWSKKKAKNGGLRSKNFFCDRKDLQTKALKN